MDLLVDVTGGRIKQSDAANVMLVAIAGQESDWRHRRQVGGPARSYWQFEQGGAVAGVMNHSSTGAFARKLFERLDIGEPSLGPWVAPSTRTVYEAMAWHDLLAGGMARLNLWWKPQALPAVGDEAGAWAYYLDTWRPGKPHPEKWPKVYAAAMAAVKPVTT